jgi:hypothetical protein
MYKKVRKKPEWLKADKVQDIYSVSSCISEDFADWINSWKHNGYWFFDNPKIMQNLAKKSNISLAGMTLFYYSAYEKQWDNDKQQWLPFAAETTITTNIEHPDDAVLQGYDLVSFSGQTCAECSPLSCNSLAEEISVNKHCLLNTLNEAKYCLESGKFAHCEPGPYRIFAVYTVENT